MREDDTISQLTHEDNQRSGSEDNDDDTGTETGSHRFTTDGDGPRQDVADENENVMGTFEDPMMEGEARRSLRDQLRRTLTREKELGADIELDADPSPISPAEKGKSPDNIRELKGKQALGGTYNGRAF